MKIKTMTGMQITNCLHILRNSVKVGQVDYDKAKAEAEPLLEELNARMEKIAQKHKKFFYKVVFSNF
jgi:ABC-type Fe3+-hydroxamate transport system substrate-binding protein